MSEEWRGKKLRINWGDGTYTDFPAKSAGHWERLKAFAEEKQQPRDKEQARKTALGFNEWKKKMKEKHRNDH